MVIVEELVDSPDCESGFCGIVPRLSPKFKVYPQKNLDSIDLEPRDTKDDKYYIWDLLVEQRKKEAEI